MSFIFRYTITLETKIETTIPASRSHGLVPHALSAYRPTSANTTIGIAIVYPNSHAICHALKFCFNSPLSRGALRLLVGGGVFLFSTTMGFSSVTLHSIAKANSTRKLLPVYWYPGILGLDRGLIAVNCLSALDLWQLQTIKL